MDKLILFIQNAKNIKIKEKLEEEKFRKTTDEDKNYNYNGYFLGSFLDIIIDECSKENLKSFIKK